MNFVALGRLKGIQFHSQHENTLATMPAVALIEGYYKTKLKITKISRADKMACLKVTA